MNTNENTCRDDIRIHASFNQLSARRPFADRNASNRNLSEQTEPIRKDADIRSVKILVIGIATCMLVAVTVTVTTLLRNVSF